MKVLLLTQAYPPHPEVGGLRAQNLARALTRAGHRVTVVCEAPPAVLAPDSDAPEVQVITVPAGVPRAARLRQALSFGRNAGHQAAASVVDSLGARPRGKLRNFVLSALSIPEASNYLIRPFAQAAEAVAQDGFDLLYSTAPPFSVHLSALRLKRKLNVPWVAEFRDPWIPPSPSRPAGLHPLTRGIDRRLEWKVLSAADSVVMVTESARDSVVARIPTIRGKVLVARNGVPDWNETDARPTVNGPFRIVHAGSLYLGRDPRPFLEALSCFVATRHLAPEELQFELIGGGRDYLGQPVGETVRHLGLERYVVFEDWLPHGEIRHRLLRANMLLLLAEGQPLQVPNKLYEYLAAQRPILAVVDQEGESAGILRDVAWARLVFESDASKLLSEFEKLYDAPRGTGSLGIPESLRTEPILRDLVQTLSDRLG